MMQGYSPRTENYTSRKDLKGTQKLIMRVKNFIRRVR
jgi:hypothetical protein